MANRVTRALAACGVIAGLATGLPGCSSPTEREGDAALAARDAGRRSEAGLAEGDAAREMDSSADTGDAGSAAPLDGAARRDASIDAPPRTVEEGDCATPGGDETVLAAAARGLSPGSYCRLPMGGLDWDLIHAPPIGAESHLEYASNGVYDEIRRVVRYHGGPHTGAMQCLEYDEASDAWSHCENPWPGSDGHGYDHTTIDPERGEMYVRRYAENEFRVWDGSAWSDLRHPEGDCDPGIEPAYGIAYDSARDGLVTMHQYGACFWSRATNDWQLDSDLDGAPLISFHQAAEQHRALGVVWMQDGNGSRRHWRNDHGTVTRLRDAPTDIGCCGSGGRWTTYDQRTERFVVTPFDGGDWWEYDIEHDEWASFSSDMPLDDEGISVSLGSLEAILFVFERGEGNDPEAFVYKHERILP